MKKLIDKIFDKLGYIPKVKYQPIQIVENNIKLLIVKREISQFELMYQRNFPKNDLKSIHNKLVRDLLDEVSKYIVITEERDILSLVYKYSAYIRVIRSK